MHGDDDERASLLSSNSNSSNSYGAAPPSNAPNARRIVFNATLKMAAIFVCGSLFLGGTLWLSLPPLEEADRDLLRIPKSFEQLQQLNFLLKKYRDIYPFRILVSYVITYLFLQAFSLPGSMYLSILGGAVWGVPRALLLACSCVATGATLCYLLSAALGPALLTVPRFKARLDSLAEKISANKENILSYLIVLRIAPLPPHWVVNVVCPHVGIGIVPFWVSTWFGILGVTVIHTTIGGGLDEMTSPDDFKLISWKNFFGLSAVVVGVMIPVGLRYWFGKEVNVEDLEQASVVLPPGAGPLYLDGEDTILAVGPPAPGKAKTLVLVQDATNDFEPYEDDSDDDEDIILEAGPTLDVDKAKPARASSPESVASSSCTPTR